MKREGITAYPAARTAAENNPPNPLFPRQPSPKLRTRTTRAELKMRDVTADAFDRPPVIDL